jgi:hypothetical protein
VLASFVKPRDTVIPAKAGIQFFDKSQGLLKWIAAFAE